MTLQCLVCECGRVLLQKAHFPIHRGMGGRSEEEDAKLPKVWLCLFCHNRMHHGEPWTIARLIERAPAYWKEAGEWDVAQPVFETWLAKQEYLRAMREVEEPT